MIRKFISRIFGFIIAEQYRYFISIIYKNISTYDFVCIFLHQLSLRTYTISIQCLRQFNIHYFFDIIRSRIATNTHYNVTYVRT